MNSHYNGESRELRSGGVPRWFLPALGLVALVAALIVRDSIPAEGGKTQPLPPTDEVGIEPNFDALVPTELTFRDEAGQPVKLAELLDDTPVLLAPVYFECPMLCGLTMNGLVRGLRGLQQQVGKDFTVITLSFDPREGPELAAAAKETALTRYGRQGAADGWHFLTGEEPAIRELMDAIGFRYKFDEASNQYAHAAGLFVLTPEGKVSRFLGGVDFTPRDLKLALAEAPGGRPASLGDQVLLLCFHYDPAQGTYGLAIMRLIRFAGLLTVGILATGIVVMLRRGSTTAEQSISNVHPAEPHGE